MIDLPLLDLFCGAGGASYGYSQVRHSKYRFYPIFGVDSKPQPRYPFHFLHQDALDFLKNEDLSPFKLIHASPPCQAYAWAARCQAKLHPNYINELRDLLHPHQYVIENVKTAPLQSPIILDGQMFGLQVIRERAFETSFPINPLPVNRIRGSVINGKLVTVAGHGGNGSNSKEDWRIAMEISWMNKLELSQAIPPAYTTYIGREFLNNYQEENLWS